MRDRAIKQLLMMNGFYVINKKVVKIFGIETAFLLTALVEASDNLSDENGWFYKTAPALEEETGLSGHKQSKIIDILELLEIIEQENKGMPMKRYFRINYDVLENLLLNNSIPCIEKIENQALKKFESKDLKNLIACIQKISNNIINNNKKINNNNLIRENKENEQEQEQQEMEEEKIVNSALKQEIYMLIGNLNIRVEQIIRLNKPIDRIRAVFKFARENNKSEGWIIGAIRDNYKLEVSKPKKQESYLYKPSSAYEVLV